MTSVHKTAPCGPTSLTGSTKLPEAALDGVIVANKRNHPPQMLTLFSNLFLAGYFQK